MPMLAHVPRERLAGLAAACPVRHFAAGGILVHRGDPAKWLLVVLEGDVSAVVDHASGARARYPLMSGPCVIDKAAVLSGGNHQATWVAVSPCRVLVLGAATFTVLLAQEQEVRKHVLRYLATQVSQARAVLADQGAGAAARVARWLLAARRPGSRPLIRLPAGQQGIAEELGLSRVTVNRALQQLVRSGAIQTRPHGVIIIDPARLTAATH